MPNKNINRNVREDAHLLREFEKPFETALHFGFTPIKTPEITKDDSLKLKSVKDPYHDPKRIQAESPFTFDALEKIALLRTYQETGLETAAPPALLAYKKPISGTFNKKSSDIVIGLDILGLPSSAAEGIIIRTALSILEDEGFKNLTIHINSLGDKDSVGDFEKAVSVFVRKHMNGFPADIRKMAKHDIFDILRSTDEKHHAIQQQAPKSISFLSERSRNDLKEVLEYLEVFDIPYEISPRLIGSPCFCSHTIFEIRTGDGDKNDLLAQGYRYGRLSKKIGAKRELPSIGITISFKKKEKITLSKGISKPKFYLIQLGPEAKLHTLPVVDILRKARISVAHSIAKDKLGSQLGAAENMKVPYVLIIGQKEAIEKSVTVRNMSTRAQETVSIPKLVEYLKKLK